MAQADVNTKVYLKNGKKIEGNLKKYVKGEYAIIVAKNGKRDSIPNYEIEKIVQSASVKSFAADITPEEEIIKEQPYRFKENGSYLALNFSTSMGTSSSGAVNAGIGTTAAYGLQFSRIFGLGLGAGVYNMEAQSGEVLYPLFAEVRGYFKKVHKSLYYYFNGGYSFAAQNENKGVLYAEGGWTAYPAVGVRLGGAKSGNIFIDAGLHLQKYHVEKRYRDNSIFGNPSEDVIVKDVLYRRLTVRAGVLF